MESFQKFANNYPWFILIVIAWCVTLKGITLWLAARRGQLIWFITLIIINTIGILEILYLISIRKKSSNFNGNLVKISSPSFWGNVSVAKQK
ncbi:DUF5652 family protein [Pelotomaculum isophthalicicum JI]|uniref:DUF5652 family protein n=1 Tax=Pelotomaculum isophthalicicum JI TaxID=947010 RepID=A0A9X4JWD9_9FIRM|nr:DUF5652 family protein [Pelotomaculum isophthalicicum]MDF9409941.1 DUF5652 family protein [Pelotomaculum isophthalicicum JI]